MMKNCLRTFVLFLCIQNIGYAEDIKDKQTKMEVFASRTGVIVKYEDYNLADILLNYGVAEARVRKLTSGGEVKYFYQISKEAKYGTKTASIAYEDLLEIQKAMTSLI